MKKTWLALGLGLLAASCAPSTPQARIAKNPEIFSNLSAREQRMAASGDITKGASKDAVLLSWGPPARRYEGSQGGKTTERWDYTGTRPVYHTHFFSGYDYGRYGHARYSGIGFGLGPEIAYVPYRNASVWFVNGKVDAWERLR